MARPLRLEFPSALYHVTARGNARQSIYLDDEDRYLFLSVLAEVVGRFFPIAVRADKALRDEAIRKACREFGYTLAAASPVHPVAFGAMLR